MSSMVSAVCVCPSITPLCEGSLEPVLEVGPKLEMCSPSWAGRSKRAPLSTRVNGSLSCPVPADLFVLQTHLCSFGLEL